MKDRWAAFLRDVLISAAISGVASLIGYTLGEALPTAAAIALAFLGIPALLYLLFYGSLYGGAIYMMASGVWKRRPGRILGPLLFVGGLAIYSHATIELQRAAAEAANTRSVEIDGSMPKIVAIERQTFCLSPCIQILATTELGVAVRPSQERPWTLFTRAAGEVCADNEHRNRAIAFLRLGFLGLCTGWGEYDVKVTDAILVDHSHTRGDWAGAGRFSGEVAYVARINNGVTTILGRWIEGRIEPAFRTFLSPLKLAPESAVIGTPFKMEEVYGAAGLTVLDSDRPGPAAIPALLAELERFRDSTKAGMGISDQFKALIKEANDPAFVSGYLSRMLNSEDVEDRKLALLGFESLQGKDLEFARPALAKGLASENRDEAYRSAVVVGRMPSKERGFAIDGLIAASLRYISDIGGTGDDRMRNLLLRLLREAARDIPTFVTRLDAWVPTNDREDRNLAKVRTMLAQ